MDTSVKKFYSERTEQFEITAVLNRLNELRAVAESFTSVIARGILSKKNSETLNAIVEDLVVDIAHEEDNIMKIRGSF